MSEATPARFGVGVAALAASVTLVGGAGCVDAVPTSDVSADIWVVIEEAGTHVFADFSTMGEEYSERALDFDADPLFVGISGQWFEVGRGDFGEYESSGLPVAEDRTYRFELRRAHAEDALGSVVTAPPPFVFRGSPGEVSRAGGELSFELDVPAAALPFWLDEHWTCGDHETGGFASPGHNWRYDTIRHRLELPAGELELPFYPDEYNPIPDRCDVDLTIGIAAEGRLDPAFASGGIGAGQQRSVHFVSVP